jgi:hypothetical protein
MGKLATEAGFQGPVFEALFNFGVSFFSARPVRHQRSLDRTGGLNKGEFLAHRKVHRSEDETANPTIEGTG